MNGTERRYAQEVLEPLKRAGRVREWFFEAITLKLGDDCRYTPDFFVVTDTGEAELHEVKGFWRDDAKVKAKVCARLYPFRVVVVRYIKKAWDREEISP